MYKVRLDNRLPLNQMQNAFLRNACEQTFNATTRVTINN
jgi:hypothetical protein